MNQGQERPAGLNTMIDATNRELLELAAKAAGYTLMDCNVIGTGLATNEVGYFDPLTDDGDALRLAAQLEFEVRQGVRGKCVYAGPRLGTLHEVAYVHTDGDRTAAWRLAIVRAAADMGGALGK